MIEKKHIPYDVVTVTTYTVSAGQTDSTPLITASGYKLDSLNPKKQKVIAISRDLKRKYKFGQKVRVKGAGKLDGVYTVRDLMAKRWRKKIDILINPDESGTKIRRVKIYNIKKDLDN
jgi:3D (Asp-Asp-Asp) domain-containing protein